MTYRLNRLMFVVTVLGLLIGAAFGPQYVKASDGPDIGTAIHRTTPTQREEIRFQRVNLAEHWSDHEVRMTIRAAVRRWPVDGGVAKAFDVAACESGFEAKDSSPGSGYEGVYQQATRYWGGRQNAYDSARWHLAENVNNARSNVVVSIRMAHSGGWGPWSCA